ncbi:hypothetical protein FSP39_007752 [Pinctada imbricata]|uniref:Uncharacterized protein n=1 Tax=Pinctada imbricata TaxID=66713 RepID=A0AA89C541_PINIB|nr:hypothetical protein FSP39_007752 [Pinctada imbricata]
MSKQGMNDQKKTHEKCTISPSDSMFAKFLDDPGVILSEFYFEMQNYSSNPLHRDVTENYKPWRWYRTRSQHGKTLLMLSFNYNVLSMSVLTIGVDHHDVTLLDSPFGCFANVTAKERASLIRDLVLDSFRQEEKSQTQIEFEQHSDRVVFVCNEIVRNNNGYAEFVNLCCHQEGDGDIRCTDTVPDSWIGLLYLGITAVKVFVFFCSPLLIPTKIYSASYAASEYVINLAKALKMKLFISRNPNPSVHYHNRLTPHDIKHWHGFQEKFEEFPTDEIVPVKVKELRIKVKGKRVIPDNDPPTGVFRTIYDNLVRCKIKRLSPFSECCDRSVYASWEERINHRCTWTMCSKAFVKIILLLIVPLPYYARIAIYYRFEQDEVLQRKKTADDLDLKIGYDFRRSNIIQYLSPIHPLFVTIYVFYILTAIVTGFSGRSGREKYKRISLQALQDMNKLSRTKVVQVLLRIAIWPFKRYGLLAMLLIPLYALVACPICSLLCALYCLPTIYLSYRLLYHSFVKTGRKSSQPMHHSKSTETVDLMMKTWKEMDAKVHKRFSIAFFAKEDFEKSLKGRKGKLHYVKQIFSKIFAGFTCLACLYALVLLFVEAVGLLVEVLAFTMMGVIVNAGTTLRYVSMALLVIVYMHDCYSNVYKNYLMFNTTITENVMDNVEDLKKVASLPSNLQENAAFQVKPVEVLDEIPTTMCVKKKETRWQIGHLVLFLDSSDTPRIPLKLFQKLCEVTVHGAPGPVYINLLRATGKFCIIVVFLFFVIIVVMAFGNVHQISSTNQTLATLAGGFVPMLLKNVLPRRSTKLNLKTLTFKGQMEEIICDFKQTWPLCDFICVRDDGKDDEEEESKGEGDGKDEEDEKKDEGSEKGKNNCDISKLEMYMKNRKKSKQNPEDPMEQDQSLSRNGSATSIDAKAKVRFQEPVAEEEEEFVDLFLYLSDTDKGNMRKHIWNIGGSNDSIPSFTMIPLGSDDESV